MQVVAHRGACKEAMENSWSAFERAVTIGADRIELDVRLTADKQVVVMHDLSLFRTASVKKYVSKLTRAEISQCRLKNGEKIPFLDEVCKKYLGRIELNIELKGVNKELSEYVWNIIRKYDYKKWVIISSFRPKILEVFAEKYPEVRLAGLFANRIWPFTSKNKMYMLMKKFGTNIVHPADYMVTDRFMKWAKKNNLTVYSYSSLKTESRRTEFLWNKLKRLGVDGHCTNYPKELKEWLDKRAK